MLAVQVQALAAPDTVTLAGTGIAPESLTSTADGAIIIGSATRQIFRAAPGKKEAQPWIDAPADGPRSVFGVLADERSNTLWACGGSVPASTSELYAFELRTGKLKARYPLPTKKGICNDISVSTDGTVYATDSTNMEVVRLAKGKSQLDVWVGGGAFGPSNGIVDGIAVVGGRVFVNTLISSKLFSVEVQPNGEAGKVSEITLDRAHEKPDGMRRLGDTLLVAETAENGTVSRVTVTGNTGRVETLRKSFAQGVVAVTIVDKVAYVLGNRPLSGSGKDGAPGRFEAVAVPLESPSSR
jgi:hypothetical protein